MPLIVKVVVPTFARVTLLVRLRLSTTSPKLRLAGVNFAVVPTPLRVTCCGLPTPSSVKLRTALRVPSSVGMNLTLTVQLAPASNEVPQVVALIRKSFGLVPPTSMLLIVKAVVPVFSSVTVFAALAVPSARVPNMRLAGDTVTVVAKGLMMANVSRGAWLAESVGKPITSTVENTKKANATRRGRAAHADLIAHPL